MSESQAASTHLHRATILHHQRRYAEAASEWRAALAQDPRDARAHAMLALCLAEGGSFQEATREAQTAIGLDPGEPFSHYVLADVLYRRNRHSDALAAVREAIRLEPDDPDYSALLASILHDQREWQACLDAANEGLSRDPEHIACNNLRAMALVKLNRRAEAGQTIGHTLRRDPDNAFTHANKGWALLHEGRPKDALHHFRESLRLDPTSDFARAGIVEALKAHNIIYRGMLMYFLWMQRLSGRAQWMIILGGWFGYRLLASAAETNPAISPFVMPLLVAYVVFALMTWLSYPLFNLLLRLNRFGRLALSRAQIIESTCIGILLGCAVLALIAWPVFDEVRFRNLAFVLGLLALPLVGTFHVSGGWPRVVMGTVTAGLAMLGLGGVLLHFLEPNYHDFEHRSVLRGLGNLAFTAFTWGVLIATFGYNFLRGVVVRR